MTTMHRTIRRLAAAAAAATTTLALFSAVVSIGEPQRSELLAKGRPAAAGALATAATTVPAATVAATASAAVQPVPVRIADAAAQREPKARR
ncbi:MAG: hypothetical protein KIT17_00735 [Rubrivivax sp.]|nr:hypothetical protein [Rubrivivax sp.]